MQDWYLLRTKAGAEKLAFSQLQPIVDNLLLPMAKLPLRQGDRTFERVSPLFPCYLFASFDLARTARLIRYTPGIRGIVMNGEKAAVVPSFVIDELISRCAEGPADLVPPPRLSVGTVVNVVGGPFEKFGAVFDGYCNGGERVAVLLSLLNSEQRVIMPVNMVMAAV